MTNIIFLLAMFVCFSVVNALDLRSAFKRSVCTNIQDDLSCEAMESYCKKDIYATWMLKNCAKICNPACRPASIKCEPDKLYCAYWKNLGYCEKGNMYFSFARRNCQNACGFCNSNTKNQNRIKITPTKSTEPKTKPRKTGPGELQVNVQECLDAHNSKRALHGASPLKWDSQLAQDAQQWALKLAEKGVLQHDSNRGSSQGENLASSWSSGGGGYTCKDATLYWYSEEKYYPFKTPPYYMQSKTGHFTQVVWKSTKRLGVGIARNGNYFYVVARYSPPGNYDGEFAKNVGRRI